MDHHAGLLQYLGTWTVMMVPMMLPSLVPMLLRYRRSVQGLSGMRLHGLTVVVGSGYYAVWAVIGAAVWAASAGLMAAEMRWECVGEWKRIGVSVVLILAGAVQLSEWKARELDLWREGSARGRPTTHSVPGAWRQGMRLGVLCSLSCGNLMLVLLAIGMTNVVAVAAVTLAISWERLASTATGTEGALLQPLHHPNAPTSLSNSKSGYLSGVADSR